MPENQKRGAMHWPLENSWKKDDQILSTALKIGVVGGALALELIVILAFAYLVWTAVT